MYISDPKLASLLYTPIVFTVRDWKLSTTSAVAAKELLKLGPTPLLSPVIVTACSDESAILHTRQTASSNMLRGFTMPPSKVASQQNTKKSVVEAFQETDVHSKAGQSE
jgi:hypothetical protein